MDTRLSTNFIIKNTKSFILKLFNKRMDYQKILIFQQIILELIKPLGTKHQYY